MPYKDAAKQKAAQKQHYLDNKDDYYARSSARAREMAEWLFNLKCTMKCERCPEDEPGCLDFHHTDPNEKDMPVNAIIKRMSRQRVLDEIAKCIVLCANCHRKEHLRLGGLRMKNRSNLQPILS